MYPTFKPVLTYASRELLSKDGVASLFFFAEKEVPNKDGGTSFSIIFLTINIFIINFDFNDSTFFSLSTLSHNDAVYLACPRAKHVGDKVGTNTIESLSLLLTPKSNLL